MAKSQRVRESESQRVKESESPLAGRLRTQRVRVLVLRAAGTNCDMESAFAFESVGAKADIVHINRLKSGEYSLDDYHILVIPGGFTYGDDIASGKILANEIKSALSDDLKRFLSDGKLVLGICNGFQVLVKSGLLPGNDASEIDATLNLNDSARFEDRWVYLRKPQTANRKPHKCVWMKYVKEMTYLPVAHGEGKFIPKDKEVLKKLRDNGQIVLRYVSSKGKRAGYPHNPNGSVDDIAGICDPTGRILGMMPHPERFIQRTQHPRWTRENIKEEGDGLSVLRSGVNYAQRLVEKGKI
ncbi:MAG: phosphoribosylformylglycinamidine synthase I [Candidatus Omnitrophota bacterium]